MNERHNPSGPGPRRHGARRPASRERPRGEARLDRERALTELRRFLDLALREMHLAVECDISAPETGRAAEGRAPAPDAMVDAEPGNTRAEPTNGAAAPEILISFRGEDADLLLEHNAELLLALEHVAHRWLRLDPRLHDQVRFDCGDYRSVRLDELKLSARVAAQRVRETGQPFRFNPMSPRERRIIHLELTGAPGVRTASEGIGDRRQLVIYPVTAKERR
jgi:predicted RNA-binding protein Jag